MYSDQLTLKSCQVSNFCRIRPSHSEGDDAFVQISSYDPGASVQLADVGLEHPGTAKVHQESAGVLALIRLPDVLFIQPSISQLLS